TTTATTNIDWDQSTGGQIGSCLAVSLKPKSALGQEHRNRILATGPLEQEFRNRSTGNRSFGILTFANGNVVLTCAFSRPSPSCVLRLAVDKSGETKNCETVNSARPKAAK